MHPTSVYPIIIFFLTTTVTVSASSSLSSSIVWTLKHAPIPDDALCSTFSGINSSCSACISNGCSYCHGTCMSIITECLNSPIAQLITLTSCNTIEEHPSVQSNSIHSHHTQSQSQSQSNTTYVPVILSMMGMMIACMIGAIYTRRSYASYKQHTHTSGAKLSQQQHDTDLETSIATIPMMDGDGLSIPLLTMPLSNMSWKDHIITSCTSASGTCYKIIFYLILFIITSLSITTLLTDMWSIHVNGSIWNASSKVIWGGYGITTISHYNDQFITTYSSYQCDDVTLPEYYRCSSHRTLTSITRGITFLAFLSLLVVLFYLITSILCCRSLSSHVIQFQAWTCLLHTTATLIYVTGPFLLQMNMNLSYRLILGPTWYICLIAALLNGCMLIPMTIRTIPAPSSSPSTCCQDPSDIIYDDIPMKSTPTADPDPIYVDMDEPVPIKTIIINVVLDKHRHED